jgi:mercuric ion transport protein
MQNAKRNADCKQPTGLVALVGIGLGTVASLCCVVPLALVALGISGTWIGLLPALAPIKPYALVLGAVALIWALRMALRSRSQSCEDESCETRTSPHLFIAIAIGVMIWLIAATDALWAPLFS